MYAINAIKDLRRCDDSSTNTSGYREKLGGLLMGLGLAGTTLVKEIFIRTSSADVDRYMFEMQTYLLNCKPMDNNHTRIICNGDIPQMPAVDNPQAENILIGISTYFQIGIMLLLIKKCH